MKEESTRKFYQIEDIPTKDIIDVYPWPEAGDDFISAEVDEKQMKALAESMDDCGLLDAIHLVPNVMGKGYYVICGSNRWKATKFSKHYKEKIPAIVHRDLTDPKDVVRVALDSNVWRKNVSFIGAPRLPVGRRLAPAVAWRIMMDYGYKSRGPGRKAKGEVTLKQIAEKEKVSVRTLQRKMRIYRAFKDNPQTVDHMQKCLTDGELHKMLGLRGKDNPLAINFTQTFTQGNSKQLMGKVIDWICDCIGMTGEPKVINIRMRVDAKPRHLQPKEMGPAFLRGVQKKAREQIKKWYGKEIAGGYSTESLVINMRPKRCKEESIQEALDWFEEVLREEIRQMSWNTAPARYLELDAKILQEVKRRKRGRPKKRPPLMPLVPLVPPK